jgi:hypothetical protein
MTVYSCHKELKVKIYETISVPVILCGYAVQIDTWWEVEMLMGILNLRG